LISKLSVNGTNFFTFTPVLKLKKLGKENQTRYELRTGSVVGGVDLVDGSVGGVGGVASSGAGVGSCGGSGMGRRDMVHGAEAAIFPLVFS